MPAQTPLVLRADELAAAASGRIVAGQGDIEVKGVSIDSRTVTQGDLFVAIRGERFDGHRFVGEAIRKGAVGVLISDVGCVDGEPEAGRPFVILVMDTTRALQLIGRFVRRASGARVVAITGSVGKTTTKELTADVLSERYDVFRTEGNLNNHIGLPLSLLELRRRPEIAVLELGMSRAGEIRTLVAVAEPEFRVWTNVAEVHSEFFDSIEGIADAKAEILESATPDTHLVVNAGDPRVITRVGGFPGRITTFGVDTSADISATDVRSIGLGGMSATIRTPVGSDTVRTRLLGVGHVANILAAVAVALQFQVPLERVLARIAEFEPRPRRGQVLRLGAITVVDDSYNSSPMALERVLDAVGHETQAGRRVAVLGEMLELGDQTEALHRRCGRAVVDAGFDALVVIGGPSAHALADGAIAAGLSPHSVVTFATSDEAADEMGRLVRAGDVVLVKGSRGVGTDRIVDRLKNAERS